MAEGYAELGDEMLWLANTISLEDSMRAYGFDPAEFGDDDAQE